MALSRENLLSTAAEILLPRLSPELDALPGITSRSPGYRKLHMMVLDGHLRTEVVNGRHYVRKAEVPNIARMLGMLPLQVEKPSRARRSSAPVEHAAA